MYSIFRLPAPVCKVSIFANKYNNCVGFFFPYFWNVRLLELRLASQDVMVVLCKSMRFVSYVLKQSQ